MKKLLLILLLLGYTGDTFAAATQNNQAPQTQNVNPEVDWNFVVTTLKKNGYTPVQIKIAIDLLKNDVKIKGDWYSKILQKEDAVVVQADDQLLIHYSFKCKVITIIAVLCIACALEAIAISNLQIDSRTECIKILDKQLLGKREELSITLNDNAQAEQMISNITLHLNHWGVR